MGDILDLLFLMILGMGILVLGIWCTLKFFND